MGAQATCTIRFRGAEENGGRARLETDTLEVRGRTLRLDIPFKQIRSVAARGGLLTVESPAGAVTLALGAAADKWAHKIQHPPSRLDKIGVKAEWSASTIGIVDQQFLRELERIVTRLSIGRVVKESDAIFFGATKASELKRLDRLKGSLKPNGALWIVRPKGRPEISEREVMAAGKAAGLVDVKVVSFSPTHTAEKFVIPVKARPR